MDTTTRSDVDGGRAAEIGRASLVTTAGYLTSVIFVAVGIAGFVPGLTTNVGDLQFAGHDSPSELLGVFRVSVLHNLVHLAFGVVGLLLAGSSARGARMFLIAGGLIYLALAVYGSLIDHDHSENFIPVNDADNWLHVGLGVGMIVLGMLPGADRSDRRNPGWS